MTDTKRTTSLANVVAIEEATAALREEMEHADFLVDALVEENEGLQSLNARQAAYIERLELELSVARGEVQSTTIQEPLLAGEWATIGALSSLSITTRVSPA